ncbi:radical SAM protein [Candidatus Sumerlaeota bacterium]|nr:radical SAM protein [Candidatus Sumerlaeota bacterium]
MSFLDRPYKRIWNTILSTADKVLSHDRVWARPLRIHLEVNDFCNLKCPHCPRENPLIPKNTGHIPIEAIRNLAPWFQKASYVGLAGNGEPFLHPQIIEILKIVTESGATPSVISNATLWKKLDIIDQVAGIGPMLLMVSIDGGTKQTFEKWRLRADFDEVRANLRELNEAKKRKGSPFPIVNFISCLMKDTIGELNQIVDVGAEAGASVIIFQNKYPYNKLMEDARVKDMDECRIAIAKARKHAEKYGIRIDWLPMSVDVDQRGSEGGSYGYLTAEDAESHVGTHVNGNGKKHRFHCDNIMHQIHVTVQGKIKFCCFWTEGEIGDLSKDDFGDLWNSEPWRQLRRDISNGLKPKPCIGCHNLVEHNTWNILRAATNDVRDLWNR